MYGGLDLLVDSEQTVKSTILIKIIPSTKAGIDMFRILYFHVSHSLTAISVICMLNVNINYRFGFSPLYN